MWVSRHRSTIAHVLYIAQDHDGSGPWLWALDTNSRATRRVAYGTEQYLSIAGSADHRRLVASVANPSASLWTVPILDHPAEDGDAKPMVLPTVRALAPRLAGRSLFYLSSQGTGDGLWRFEDGKAVEILKGSDEALFEPPAVSADGRQLAVILRRDGKLRLHVLSADGGDLQSLAEPIDIRGSVCWSPDGKWIVAGGIDDRGPGLFKIPLDHGAPVRLIAGTARDPVWSPSGDLIVYTGANVSVDAPLLAIRPDGTKVELPAIRLRVEGQALSIPSKWPGARVRARTVSGAGLLAARPRDEKVAPTEPLEGFVCWREQRIAQIVERANEWLHFAGQVIIGQGIERTNPASLDQQCEPLQRAPAHVRRRTR